MVEPFLGSGTTVIAAQCSGRVCRGIKFDPFHVETVVLHWQKFARLEAVRQGTSHTVIQQEKGIPMHDKDQNSTYEVGFGKPPARSRFREGVSGNPKGRPKGRRNLATVLEQTLQEKVVINENGVCKTMTKLEAAVKQLVDKATKGDLAALRQLTGLAGLAVEQGADTPTNQLAEVDLEVMQGVLKRLEGCTKGEDGDN